MKHNWDDRIAILDNPEIIKNYFEAYHIGGAAAVIDFITRFCLTYDPRKMEDRVVPFELFPKQERYIEWLWDRYIQREDGVVDKCRGIGMSWLNSAFSAFLLLFQNSVTISMYTYKADECHSLGNMDTLMEKIIFICDNLPELFVVGIEHKLMQVRNVKNGSIVVGKSGDSPGRGGRSSMYFLDECAFYPRADSIEAAVSRNADCKIWGSTHHGTSTLFYRKCTSGINSVFTFDWWELGAMYTQEWYDTEKEKATAEGTLHIFKQEVERDASASLESVVCPSEWVNSSKRIDPEKIEHDLHGKKIAALDPANEGGDVHGFVITDGNIPIYAEESGEGDPGDATDLFFWKAVKYEVEEFRYDPIGVGAGVKVRIKEILANVAKDKNISDEEKSRISKIKIVPWSASGAIMRPNEEDMKGIKNGRMFENAKAQMWWKLREEFRNTYRYLNGKEHDISQVIYFPETTDRALNKMLMEISQPQYKLSSSGKTMIDKKPKGTQSPNLADAYGICRAEVKKDFVAWTVI